MSTYKSPSKRTSEILEASSLSIECKLSHIMAERGITQTELSELTGIRQATINDLIHDRKYSINKNHIKALMLVLKLTRLDELYVVKFQNPAEEAAVKAEQPYVKKNGKTADQSSFLEEQKRCRIEKRTD